MTTYLQCSPEMSTIQPLGISTVEIENMIRRILNSIFLGYFLKWRDLWFVLRRILQYNLQEKSFPFPAHLYDHKLKGKVMDRRHSVLFQQILDAELEIFNLVL